METETETETADSSTRKRARAGSTAADRDRLGDLPDCLLRDILSLLGSRQAVQTSALSRRWRHLWRSVPCVDIDQREFRATPAPAAGAPRDWKAEQDERQRQWESFEDFADNILSLLDGAAPLDALRLRLVDECVPTTIDRWIRRGLRRRPAEVDIHWTRQGSGINMTPPKLSLGSGTGTCRLTRLHLFGMSLGFGFGEHLGSLCPVLEDLHIERCTRGFRTITSPTLKSLAVVRLGGFVADALVLAAPRLTSLRLVPPFAGSTRSNAVTAPENEVLESLVEASISITDTDHDQRVNKRRRDFLTSMCNFLARLPNVRNLDLSGFTTTALLDEETLDFPLFHNLRTLLLDHCDVGDNCQALRSIFRNAPNLEKLSLHHCKFLGILKRKRGIKAKSKRTSSRSSKTTFHCNGCHLDKFLTEMLGHVQRSPGSRLHRAIFVKKTSASSHQWRERWRLASRETTATARAPRRTRCQEQHFTGRRPQSTRSQIQLRTREMAPKSPAVDPTSTECCRPVI